MKDGIESLGRIKLQGFALLALAFVTGALAGAVGDRLLTRRAAPEPSFEQWGRPGMTPPFLERLDLTDEQRARIRSILEASRPVTDSILEETMPRLRAVTDSVRREIHSVLTPEQRERLERQRPRFRRQPGFGPNGSGRRVRPPGRPPRDGRPLRP